MATASLQRPEVTAIIKVDGNSPSGRSNLVLKEHAAAGWLEKDTLYSVDWLPADVTLIEKLAAELSAAANAT